MKSHRSLMQIQHRSRPGAIGKYNGSCVEARRKALDKSAEMNGPEPGGNSRAKGAQEQSPTSTAKGP